MKKKFNSHVVKANASKLHKMVFELLRERFPGFTIAQEYPFEIYDELDKKHVLFFDLMIKELDIAIECQGRQHFEANSHFHSESGVLAAARKNDALKRKWCEMNDVTLVEIRYDDKVTTELIERKIQEALNGSADDE